MLILWQTSLLRRTKLTVRDEVSNGLSYYDYTFLTEVPRLYQMVERQVRDYAPALADQDIASFLRLGSWIGGDRDGHPNVTPGVTLDTLRAQRAAISAVYREAVAFLREHLTQSTDDLPPAGALRAAIAQQRDGDTLRFPGELYSEMLDIIWEKLGADSYGSGDDLLADLRQTRQISIILITHDISTSSDLADEVLVMYAGQLVEHSLSTTGYTKPLHPYAHGLMSSVPTLREDKKLEFIPGQPPSLINPPTGCRFAARCPRRFDRCDQEPPTFTVGNHGELVKCWLHAKG